MNMRFFTLTAVLLLALSMLSLPASADDESEAESAPLSVEVLPGLTTPGKAVNVKATYELDAESSEDPEESESPEAEESESDEPEEAEGAERSESPEAEESESDEPEEAEGAERSESPEAEESESDEPEEAEGAERSESPEPEKSESDEPEEAEGAERSESPEPEKSESDEPEEGEERNKADEEARLARDKEDVHFTIDFGDETSTAQSEETDTALGSQESGTAEAMKPIARGRDDIDRAIAHHVYDEPGAYTITVTATPDEGASETVEVTVHVGQGSARVSGDSRVDTAIDVSRESFPERGSAGGVLLTRGDAYADALAAASLSGQRDAPILLTGESNLHQSVLDEINRVLADDGVVTVLGGEQAVAPAVVETLESAGLTAERISGPDRIATALGIAESVAGVERDEDEAPDAIVASAEGFADALSASSFAAQSEAPILLTGSDELDERVAAFLEELGGDAEVILAGGPAAISERVAEQLSGLVGSVERIGGSDRFATSARMADELFPDSDVAVVATGGDFADALAGGAAAGRLGAPIVLVGDVVPESVAAELSERVGETKSALVLGGDAAVPEDVRQEVGAALGLD